MLFNSKGEYITPANVNEETHFIKQLQTISALIAVPSRMFVTSTHWGQIAAEIKRQYASALADPSGLPTPKNFDRLKIGMLTVINAGTEDGEVVNLMNEEDARNAQFQQRRTAFQTGRA